MLAMAFHATFLIPVLWQSAARGDRSEIALAQAPLDPHDSIEVSEADFARPEPEPEKTNPPAAPAPSGLTADMASISASPQAPRQGVVLKAPRPAPDTGRGPGMKVPASWRRDRSTLRERLTDGVAVYQPSREGTHAAASSPQALRREPVVGIGDSSRAQSPRQVTEVMAASEDESAPPAAGTEGGTGEAAVKGEGPVDAIAGRRTFDVDREGRAKDSEMVRAASNEPRPGIIDFSAAAAMGPKEGTSGRGPAATPGAVSQPARGTGASVAGSPQPVAVGAVTELSAAEREYQRNELEIRRRVSEVLRFPRKLAVMLEQGETILRFAVQMDGRIAGQVQVVKSAGFEEFDQEAVGAVNRAAPFPKMSRPINVSMRVPFQNPVIR
jgi:TonB family protein